MSSDANDYTRFNGIEEDSDDEGKAPTPSASTFQESLVSASICKDKGNALFNEGNFEESKANYEDGLNKLKEFVPKDGIGEMSVDLKTLLVSLYGNSAMVALKLNNHRDALQASSQVLKYDPSNVKSLYRRAVAYNNLGYYDDAKDDLAKILAMDPSNTSAKKELIDVQRNIKEKKENEKKNYANLFSGTSIYEDREKERLKKLRREEEEKAKLEDDWTKSKLSRRAQGLSEQTFEEYKQEQEKIKEEEQQQQAARKAEAPVTSKKAVNKRVDDDEQYDDEEAKIIEETKKKGYCYFKKEQSSEVKELIGDISPRALGSADTEITTPSPVVDASSSIAGNSKASSWNFAGTFEAREMTSVATERFKSKLESISFTTDDGCNAIITSVKVDGEAQIVHTRGRTKYIYDFNVSLDFEITVDEASESSKKYKGVIKFPDVSADFNQENSISYKKTIPSDHQTRVRAAADKLVHQVIENWRNFDVEYKSM